MKKLLLILITYGAQLQTMELSPEIRGLGTTMFKALAYHSIEKSKINLQDKFIIDIASQSGEISHHMAQFTGKSGHVMGINEDIHIINAAKKNYTNQPNLSFHHGSLETLEPSQHSLKFHVATIFNYFDLIDDKQQICKKIYRCLHPLGEILVNAGCNEEPLDCAIAREMVESNSLLKMICSQYNLNDKLTRPYPTEQEYRNIFNNAGFDIISLTPTISEFYFEKEEDFTAIKQPIIMSRPEMQLLPSYVQSWICNKFIQKFLTKLKKNDAGHYIYPVNEIIIHARKKKRVQQKHEVCI